MEANLTTQAASAVKQAQVKNEASIVVAKKVADTQKLQGEAAVSLLKQAEQLSAQIANGNIDVEL